MMGRREEGQGQFFYSFDLDKVVPPDHLVRQIDGFLDLSWVYKELAPNAPATPVLNGLAVAVEMLHKEGLGSPSARHPKWWRRELCRIVVV